MGDIHESFPCTDLKCYVFATSDDIFTASYSIFAEQSIFPFLLFNTTLVFCTFSAEGLGKVVQSLNCSLFTCLHDPFPAFSVMFKLYFNYSEHFPACW